MPSRFHPVASALVAAACAAGAHAQYEPMRVPGTPNGGAASGVSPADRQFVQEAAEASHAKVQAARLALSRSGDPDVRAFAQRMIDDHTETSAQLQQLAQADGLKLPADPSLAQRVKLNLLEIANGPDFNQRYADEFGVEIQRRSLELFGKAAVQAQDPELKDFANKMLAKLREHLQLGQTLQASVQATVAATRDTGTVQAPSDDLREARQNLNGAVQVVQRMKSTPETAALLGRAKGVFILPRHGEGVLVTRQGQGFSNPVFYRLGGAGAQAGELVFLLMTDRAVQSFQSDQTFSINADAGFTIVDHARQSQASTGKVEDVIVWSGTRSAPPAGTPAGLTGMVFDSEANRAYYRRTELNPSQILGGSIINPERNELAQALQS